MAEVDVRIPESLRSGNVVSVYNSTQSKINTGVIISSFFCKDGMVKAHIQIDKVDDISYSLDDVLSIGKDGESDYQGTVRHYTSTVTHDLNCSINPITE